MSQVPLAPPPPTKEPIFDRWTYLLWRRLTQAGQILWGSIDKSGSNLTDLETRNHNDLQALQGGTTSEYYHVTASSFLESTRSQSVLSTAIDPTLDDNAATCIVTVTGKTITLPNATAARVGRDWSIHLAVDGNMTIAADASDTIMTPVGTDTTVYADIRATALTFRCTSSSTWILV